MQFYGRKEELKTLSSQLPLLEKSSRFVVVTGRRRVGKTTLITKFAKECGSPFLYFFIQRGYSESELIQSCLKQIQNELNLEGFPGLTHELKQLTDPFPGLLDIHTSDLPLFLGSPTLRIL